MKPRHIVLKFLLILCLGLLLAAFACFFFPQQVLTVDSGAGQADAMVVLGGGSLERAERAAELFKAGETPRIICSGLGDAGVNAAFLTNSDVPTAAILLEPKSHTTRENAKFSIPLLRALGAKRVIIVTTWYHSRRALACFEHYAPDIKFYSRPAYFGYLRRSEDGRRTAEDGGSAPQPCPLPDRGGEGARRAEGRAQGAGRLHESRVCETARLLDALWRVPVVKRGGGRTRPACAFGRRARTIRCPFQGKPGGKLG